MGASNVVLPAGRVERGVCTKTGDVMDPTRLKARQKRAGRKARVDAHMGDPA
jgi:hypothetical protein